MSVVASALVFSALQLRLRLPRLGETPSAEALSWVIAYSDELCVEDRCRQKPEAVKVGRTECQPLSANQVERWKEWDAIGGARCSFSYTSGGEGERSWSRVTRTLVYRKHACGDVGQETDMWCYMWHDRYGK